MQSSLLRQFKSLYQETHIAGFTQDIIELWSHTIITPQLTIHYPLNIRLSNELTRACRTSKVS
jgi:hypothetical protein